MSQTGAYLRLARISNLPTVWSNVLAAGVLAGGLHMSNLVLLMLAMSLFYTGGMFLNDAFDAKVDARDRPQRPIPAGIVSVTSVWAAGSAMLLLGIVLMFAFGTAAGVAGIALAVAILVYDGWHKGNQAAPVIMGACRALVYVATWIAAGRAIDSAIIWPALALLAYIAGLTFAAKQEELDKVEAWWPLALLASPALYALAVTDYSAHTIFWAAASIAAIVLAVRFLIRRGPGDVPRAVSLMIATIALNDAALASTTGDVFVPLLCGALFAATLALQRYIPGT